LLFKRAALMKSSSSKSIRHAISIFLTIPKKNVQKKSKKLRRLAPPKNHRFWKFM